MGRVDDKVAIVTGGASGMGRAHAQALANEGASVVVTDVNDDGGNETVKSITDAGGKAIYVHHDISKSEDWDAVVKAANDAYGKINVLVNNAGVYTFGEADTITDDQWNMVFDVNVRGTFFGCRAVIPEMKKAGGGSIVNISSNFAIVGVPGFSVYSASKGAVRLFTKGLGAELAQYNIRANSIHPGLVETDMTRPLIPNQEAVEGLIANAPMRFAAQPEQISGAVIYLASEESSFMTGSEIVIDGGYHSV